LAAGIPPLGQQAGSPSGVAINFDHEPVKCITPKPFNSLKKFNGLRLNAVWQEANLLQLESWGTESDIQAAVKLVLSDVIVSAGLKKTVKIFNELSVFSLRADIWLVSHRGTVLLYCACRLARVVLTAVGRLPLCVFVLDSGEPVGLVEIKKPPRNASDAGATQTDLRFGGQCYDYLRRLATFHGLRDCWCIATDYVSWRFFWLPSEHTNASAASDDVRLTHFASRALA